MPFLCAILFNLQWQRSKLHTSCTNYITGISIHVCKCLRYACMYMYKYACGYMCMMFVYNIVSNVVVFFLDLCSVTFML